MNKYLFPVRALWGACALVCLAAAWLPLNVTAQTPATGALRPAAIRSADFIVAVVNSEPITNHQVRLEAQRMARQLSQGQQPVPDPREMAALEVQMELRALAARVVTVDSALVVALLNSASRPRGGVPVNGVA